jgi:hypothetical protein
VLIFLFGEIYYRNEKFGRQTHKKGKTEIKISYYQLRESFMHYRQQQGSDHFEGRSVRLNTEYATVKYVQT